MKSSFLLGVKQDTLIIWTLASVDWLLKQGETYAQKATTSCFTCFLHLNCKFRICRFVWEVNPRQGQIISSKNPHYWLASQSNIKVDLHAKDRFACRVNAKNHIIWHCWSWVPITSTSNANCLNVWNFFGV